jgi:acetyl-CoA C-acetyltransferase
MSSQSLWLAAGVRTPFAKVDGSLAGRDAISLSVPVVQAMCGKLKSGDKPDLLIWGTVAPSLRWSNIAREVALDAGLDPYIPAFTSVMACATSMVGVFAAADTVRSRIGGWFREHERHSNRPQSEILDLAQAFLSIEIRRRPRRDVRRTAV